MNPVMNNLSLPLLPSPSLSQRFKVAPQHVRSPLLSILNKCSQLGAPEPQQAGTPTAQGSSPAPRRLGRTRAESFSRLIPWGQGEPPWRRRAPPTH